MGYFEDKNERSNYKSDGPKRRNDSGGGDRFGDNKTLTTVTCDACGKSCTVPFKPSAGKPVYCNDCFRKDDAPRTPRPSFNSGSDSRSRSNDSGSSNRDLAQINAKLDKILALLEQDID